MQSIDSLSVIVSYCDLEDLFCFVRINKKCRRAGDNPRAWRAAFEDRFVKEMELFGRNWRVNEDLTLPWKRMCLRSLRLNTQWSSLSPSLTLSGSLPSFMFSSLISPDLPILSLRRSSDTMSSFYLQLLAESSGEVSVDAMDVDDSDLTVQLKQVLDQQALSLYAGISTPEDEAYLSQLYSGRKPTLPPNAPILKLVEMLRSTIQFHCSTSLAVLVEAATGEDLAVGYSQRWGAYCSSMQAVSGVVQCVWDILWEMAEAKWPQQPRTRETVVGVMTEEWKNTVFLPIKEKLESAGCALIAECISKQPSLFDPQTESLQSLHRDFMDLSVPSNFCRQATDPSFLPLAPYSSIAQKTANTAIAVLSASVSDPIVLSQRLESAIKTINFVYSPCTAETMEEKCWEMELTAVRSYYKQRIDCCSAAIEREITTKGAAFGAIVGVTSEGLGKVEEFLEGTDRRTREYVETLICRVHPEYDRDYRKNVLSINQHRQRKLVEQQQINHGELVY